MDNTFKFSSLIPNSYSFIKTSFRSSYSPKAFRAACNRSWVILASLPFFDLSSFPQDRSMLKVGLGDNSVDVQCSNDVFALLKFSSLTCPAKKEHPITYQLFNEEYAAKHKWLTKCLMGPMTHIHSQEITIHIGYINERIWYLLKKESYKDEVVAVALMIFGRDIPDKYLEAVINETIKEVNRIYFNNTLGYHEGDLILRDNGSTCQWKRCYENIISDKTTVASVPEMPKKQFDLVLFLSVVIPVGIVGIVLIWIGVFIVLAR